MRKFNAFIFLLSLSVSLLFAPGFSFSQKENSTSAKKYFIISKKDLSCGAHHTNHFKFYGKNAKRYSKFVLKGIDKVQATQIGGGGYFIGLKADPPESPTGYEVKLFGHSLIKPTRMTSYCSGSTYSAFIEAMNLLYQKDTVKKLSPERMEAMRMQEPDGTRRNDNVKFWGKWNADGFGNHFALLQYAQMGKVIKPEDARPGDFMNISWKSGNGHSVIFLGWYIDENNVKNIVYWSSQPGTNGFGDQMMPVSKISDVMVVRLTNPNNLFKFDVSKKTDNKVEGYKIEWN
jgi:hypothetical protein